MDKLVKKWINSYPEGVPHEIGNIVFNSLLDMYEFSVAKYPDRVAFVSMGQQITFAELDAKVRNLAAYMQCTLKVKPGTKVALMLPNIIQYPVILFAAIMAGATVVNINPMYKAPEVAHQLKDSGAKIIFVISNFAQTLQKAMLEVELEHVIITSIGDECGFKGSLINFVVKYFKRLVPHFHIENAIPYKQALLDGENLPYQRPMLKQDDLAFLQYTGGTTGQSKGAMLTHLNILSNTEQALALYKNILKEGEESVVTAIPLYHAFALCANLFLCFRIGATNLLIADPRNINNLVKEMTSFNPSIITGVNTLFNALCNNELFCNSLYPNLRLVIAGGTSVQPGVAQRWFIHTGLHILEGYGLTECSPIVSICPYTEDECRGTIGIPLPSTEVVIKDKDGKVIDEINEPGELCVKGPQVMKGYYGREVATSEVFDDDGYLHTGDVACWSNDKGFLKIVDRQKDLILVSGFNVYPNEIEGVITLHPNVLEVAVIGVPSKKTGEAVKAFIVKKHKSLTEEMIIAMCKKHLTAYKVPKFIEFVDSLPKSNVGKVLRTKLREQEKGKFK